MLDDCVHVVSYTLYLNARRTTSAGIYLQPAKQLDCLTISWAEVNVDARVTMMSRGADISNTKLLKTACPTGNRGMRWKSLPLLALVASLISGASANDAQCTSGEFAWANNKEGKDPCQVANALVTKCSNAPFPMLSPGTAMYGGPGDNNECLCNLVEYNLLRVCAKCQSATDAWVEDFPDWSKNCAKQDQVEFGPGAPDGVSIPDWASGGNIGGPWSLDALKPAAPAQPEPSPAAVAEAPAAPEQPEQPEQQQVPEEPPEPPVDAEIEEPEATAKPILPEPTEEVREVEAPKAMQAQEAKPEPTITSEEEETTTPPSPTPTPRENVKADVTALSTQETTSTPKPVVAKIREGDPTRAGNSGGKQAGPTETEKDQEETSGQRIRLKPGKTQDGEAGTTPSDLELPPSRQNARIGDDEEVTTSGTTGESLSDPTKTIEPSAPIDDSMPEETSSSSVDGDEDPLKELAGPTDLAVMPTETSTDTATELLVDQDTKKPEDASISTNEDVSTLTRDELGPKKLTEDGSYAKSSPEGQTGDDVDTALEEYQYNGDPGVAAAESEGSGGKGKIAAICISVFAILALTVIAFKLFMCLRKRKAESDERESWMEAEAGDQEKSESAAPRGILSRQSVWERIQRSLMPKTMMGPDPAANRASSNADVVEGGYGSRSDRASSQLPSQSRRSFWSNMRESFGPFGRPSFVAPAPTPNLSALRGIPLHNPFRGILKRPRPRADPYTNAQEQEVLEDEEAIRPRQIDPRPPLAGIPYYAGTEWQQQRWI